MRDFHILSRIGSGQSANPFLLLIPVAVIALVVIIRVVNSPDRRLRKWAERSGVKILSRQERCIDIGPFKQWKYKGDTYFRIRAHRSDGVVADGWVRFASIGSIPDVRWDDEMAYWPEMQATLMSTPEAKQLSNPPTGGFEVIQRNSGDASS